MKTELGDGRVLTHVYSGNNVVITTIVVHCSSCNPIVRQSFVAFNLFIMFNIFIYICMPASVDVNLNLTNRGFLLAHGRRFVCCCC